MKEHIKTLPHHPKRVILISLAIAIVIGIFGYIKINQKSNDYLELNSEMLASKNSVISENQNLTLGFLSGGRIKSVLVKSGDRVTGGQILATLDAGNASGALMQAKAAYATAEANYEKVINGATEADVTVSNSSVEISQTNLVHSKESLILALNNSLTTAENAVNNNTNIVFNNPNSENLELASTNAAFNNQTLENKIVNERLLLNKMFSLWTQELGELNSDMNLIDSENNGLGHLQDVAVYLDNLNLLFTQYDSAGPSSFKTSVVSGILSARTSITNQITSLTAAGQAVSNAERNVEQSQAIFKQKTSEARPEDIEIAKAQVNNAFGAVQIAEAAYQNTVIIAPSNGIVISVSILPGQIAIPNAPAIEFLKEDLTIKNVK